MGTTSKPPVQLFSALADTTRCRIVERLRAGPVPVHALADLFPISRPAISRHLRVLKEAGLVTELRRGRENFYKLNPCRLDRATRWLEAIAAKPAPMVMEPDVAIQPAAIPAAPKRPANQMGFDF